VYELAAVHSSVNKSSGLISASQIGPFGPVDTPIEMFTDLQDIEQACAERVEYDSIDVKHKNRTQNALCL